MPRRLLSLACLLAVAAVAGPAPGQFGPPGGGPGASGDSRDKVRVSVKAASDRVPAGGDLPVAVVLEIAPGWHVWTDDRDLPEGMETYEFAIRTAVAFDAAAAGPLEIHDGFIAWPEPHAATADVGDGPVRYGVFEGRAIVAVPVTVPADAAPGPATLPVTVTFQACDDRQCLAPVDQTLELSVEIVPAGTATAGGDPDPDFAGFPVDVFGRIRGGDTGPEVVSFDLFGLGFDLDAAAPAGLALLLLVAALGGALLNFTPCVLPIIPLKIMGLSQAASGRRGRTLALGVAMFAGIIAFWLVLGGLIAGIKGFTATNQLFHYPLFTIGVGLFIALMAVGMCGLFSVQLPQAVYMVNPSHETLHGSFVFGILAAVLSTPCTAPFMGAAAGWAATKTPGIILLVFAAIGVGMGVPYLVLSAFPRLVERMPRTGPASELIKHVMGLLMLAAAAYFIGVGLSGLLVTPPDPPSRLYWWLVAACGTAAGGWLAWRTFRIAPSAGRRVVFGGVGALIVAASLAVGVRLTDQGPIEWVYYTPDRFDDARSDGRVVVMEFTAEWCLNCKTLEETVLRSPRIVELLEQDDVVPIKVDLTGNNVDGKDMLGRVNRLTIPLLVIFAPDGTEVFKGDFYTVEQVLEAVRSAGTDRVAAR